MSPFVYTTMWILTSADGRLHKESSNAECAWCRAWLYQIVRDRWKRSKCDVHCYKCGTKYFVDRRD